jgi:hypothetical protein
LGAKRQATTEIQQRIQNQKHENPTSKELKPTSRDINRPTTTKYKPK